MNLEFDVEMDGVTYRLSSSFAEKTEMGEVIDTAELERSGLRKNFRCPAESYCFTELKRL